MVSSVGVSLTFFNPLKLLLRRDSIGHFMAVTNSGKRQKWKIDISSFTLFETTTIKFFSKNYSFTRNQFNPQINKPSSGLKSNMWKSSWNWTVKFERQNSHTIIWVDTCRVFWTAFRCLQHLKAGRTTFFQPFSTFSVHLKPCPVISRLKSNVSYGNC